MYELSVSRSFVAQHFLTVADPGPEGECHSHRYTVEVAFVGPSLNASGYLVDIDALEAALDAVVEQFADRTLNDLEPFAGLNPSVEHFSRIFGDRLLERIEPETATHLRVTMREDDIAAVQHERTVSTEAAS